MTTKLQSILLGGVIVGLAVPFMNLVPVLGACLCCLAFIGAGMLSSYHYTDSNQITIKGGEGAGLGAGSGAVAGVVASVVSFLLMGFGIVPDAAEMLRELEDAGVFEGMDRDTEDMFINMMESMYVPISFVMNVLGGVILGLIGGIMGASLFKKGEEGGSQDADYEIIE